VQTTVSVATNTKPEMQTFRILQNVTGVFRPGTITLLVGPPAGGKSMLMKALCGAAPVATAGSITYNGYTLDEFNVVRTAQYVSQHDLHNSELTVKETLIFSAMCQGPGYSPGASVANKCCILMPDLDDLDGQLCLSWIGNVLAS
jgi:ABC-type multidrug transport system ATPase subunit